MNPELNLKRKGKREGARDEGGGAVRGKESVNDGGWGVEREKEGEKREGERKGGWGSTE